MIGTTFLTFLKGIRVGSDLYGNVYFEERFLFSNKNNRRPRRWVVYKGIAEGSKVPAEWHGWLHFTSEALPSSDNKKYSWQKDHMPNLSGTRKAYRPKINRHATYYKAWSPNGN